MDLQKLMRAAQDMQTRMADAQAELDKVEVEGVAGGGMVRVTATAKGKLLRVAIDDSLMSVDDKDVLEDLIVAAINDARSKGEAAAQEHMGKLTQGLPLPPGFKLPF